MPWTRKQVKYLFSKGSPLTPAQMDKMHAELHADPSMGHMKKGFSKGGMQDHLVSLKKQGHLKSSKKK